jgi:hypothetical protein
MVGEDDNVLRAVLAGALEFGLEPEFLFGELVGGVLRRVNDHRAPAWMRGAVGTTAAGTDPLPFSIVTPPRLG